MLEPPNCGLSNDTKFAFAETRTKTLKKSHFLDSFKLFMCRMFSIPFFCLVWELSRVSAVGGGGGASVWNFFGSGPTPRCKCESMYLLNVFALAVSTCRSVAGVSKPLHPLL